MEKADKKGFTKNWWKKLRSQDFFIFLYKITFQLVSLLPARKNVIMFESFLGRQYSDNPRAIYEYIKENYPHYKMYWSIDPKFKHNFDSKDIVPVKRFSIKWLFLMATAKYWVTNSRMPLWIPKPAHTTYLQTWHGTPLKKLAADMEEVYMPGTDTNSYKVEFYLESRNWDYLISPNPYSTKIFRRAFQFEKEILEVGYPRNDVLYKKNNEDAIQKIKEQLNLPQDKKIILYAPTWRDDQFVEKGKYTFDLHLDLDQMKHLATDYCLILRLHYLVGEQLDLSPYKEFVFDFSNYTDIRELYLISDVLVTDYSSVFFDFANLKRPMIFYTYDIEDYRERLRGFYFDLEKNAPGSLVKSTEEVIAEIKRLENENWSLAENYADFYEKFCALESGHSSQKVVDRIFLKENSLQKQNV